MRSGKRTYLAFNNKYLDSSTCQNKIFVIDYEYLPSSVPSSMVPDSNATRCSSGINALKRECHINSMWNYKVDVGSQDSFTLKYLKYTTLIITDMPVT